MRWAGKWPIGSGIDTYLQDSESPWELLSLATPAVCQSRGLQDWTRSQCELANTVNMQQSQTADPSGVFELLQRTAIIELLYYITSIHKYLILKVKFSIIIVKIFGVHIDSAVMQLIFISQLQHVCLCGLLVSAKLFCIHIHSRLYFERVRKVMNAHVEINWQIAAWQLI